MNVKTVCIVEDNHDLNDALSLMVQHTVGYELRGSFLNAEEAYKFVKDIMPDVVIMDLNLPGDSGIECIRKLKLDSPKTLFLVCTAFEENDKIFESLRSGASGYILKSEGPSKIIDSIKSMIDGGSPMSGQIARKVVESFNSFNNLNREIVSLTDREVEILSYLSKGLLNKEIAEKVQISAHTVRKHIQHIYEKLQVNTRVEAVNKYYNK